MANWTLKTLKLSSLRENKKNPRRISKEDAEQLKLSIERFGICEPLVANKDGTIIGGHQRFRTLKKLGYKEVPVYVHDEELTSSQVDELTVRLNRNTGEFDYEILANEYEIVDLLNWGFTEGELEVEKAEEQEENKPTKLVITFIAYDHLEDAEPKIADLLNSYIGSTYKVRK